MKKTKFVAIVLMVSLMATLFSACGSKTIDLRDYVSVEFQGANGYGSAKAKFDEDALAEDLMDQYGSKIKKAAKGNEIYEDDPDLYAEMIAELFYVRTDGENLSNKDKVTVKIEFDGSLEKIKKNAGIEFKNFECEFTVSGLGEVAELDVFENMEMKISGISPNLSASFSEKETGKYGFYVKYSLVANAPVRYKVGDTVNVKASFSEGADLAHGYIVNQLEKSIVITDDMAEQYISNAMDFDSKTIEELEIRATAEASSYYTVENNKVYVSGKYLKLNTAESIGQPELQSVYLCYSENPGLKALDYSPANNFLCFAYKFRVNNAYYAGGTLTPEQAYDGDAYAYAFVANVTKLGDSVSYNLDAIGCSTQTFLSIEELHEYIISCNYTISEVSGF